MAKFTRDAVIELYPAHPSTRGMFRSPRNMEHLPGVTHEMVEMLERVSLGIFADMTNAGRGFREALAAIYLSGLQHGAAVSERTPTP